jgi:hypothetical protein
LGDANDFLMRGGTASAAFPTAGTVVKGIIVREPELQQQKDFQTKEPKTWDDGSPMMQVKVILATDERDADDPDDDGERALYLKGNSLKAVQAAVKEAKAKGLQVGGKLAVKYVRDGEQKTKGLAKPKLYAAKYEAPDPMSQAAASEPEAKAEPAAEPEDTGDLTF